MADRIAGTMPADVRRQVPAIADAWSITRGSRAIIAVVDADVDVRGHPDFSHRVHDGYHGSWPSGWRSRHVRQPHGVKVAGIALANGREVVGIAPDATLLPIAVPALAAATGDPSEADALRWAADHGADVICCAWAPTEPSGARGRLPGHTRAAIDHCLTRGRNGKGCVIIFAAGNDGCDIAPNEYASHPGVIAVGACNGHGTHPSYSGWGDALWCVFPSNDPQDPQGATMTYLTTAPAGSLLDGEAYYTTRFGFTSAATAAVAGICALIVSANPDLTAADVKVVLRDACVKIDVAGGAYDDRGHSPLYGYGRPDVPRAVALAHARTARHAALEHA